MAVKKGKKKGRIPSFRTGLLLLPPGGWAIEKEVGRAARELWSEAGCKSVLTHRLRAERRELVRHLRRWADRERLDVVCTVGRSGHLAGDFAPDVTRPLLERTLPGIEERMYLAVPRRPEDLLFRGAAGIRRGTLIVNLPDRAARVRVILGFLAPVLGHALEKIAGDESECARP